MTTYLQLLSLDTVSCSPCIVVATESSRFLFDSGEGIQRLCTEHRARISKLEGVYLTRLCPETVGGLPGLFLTAADSGKSQFSIVGPRGTASFWASTGHFMRRSMFSISISELEPTHPILSQEFTDMTIHSLPIGLTHSSYICETPQLAGKFDVAKALSLKIPKGPMFAKLKGGNSVFLQDGTEIRPHQVLEEAVLGRYVAIACCIESWEQNLLEELLNHRMFSRFQVGGDLVGRMDCIVHLSPHDVVTSQAYKTWMEAFTPSTIHVMSGRGICLQQSSFIAATRQNMKHHLLCPDFFSCMSLEVNTPHSMPLCDSDGFCRLHLNTTGEGLISGSTEEAVAGSTVNVISGKKLNGLTGLTDPDSISIQGTPFESSVSAVSGEEVTGSVCVLRGAALMRYDMLPTRRRGLVAHDPLRVLGSDVTRDRDKDRGRDGSEPAVKGTTITAAAAAIKGNSAIIACATICTNGVSNVEMALSNAPSKLMEIASNNGPENPRACTPTDPELMEFWNKVGDNNIIRNSLNYAAKVRRKAGVDRDLTLELPYRSRSNSNNNTPCSSSSSSSSSSSCSSSSSSNGSSNGSRSVGSSSHAIGSYGYPTVADIGTSDDIQNLKNMKLEKIKPQCDVAVDDDDGPEYTKTFEAAERDLEKENRKISEMERMELNYHFTQYQADLLKLAGTLGGSIVFLGTACAIPSKYRNVSGILLTLPTPVVSTSKSGRERTHMCMGQSTMLLDAGEGTWQQLVRVAHHTPALVATTSIPAGVRSREINKETGTVTDTMTETERKAEVIQAGKSVSPLPSVEETLARNLKVIWISHPHADHHLGLLMILSERKRLLTGRQSAGRGRDREKEREGPVGVSGDDDEFSPLLLIAPPSVLAFLRDYCLLDEGGLVRGSYIPVSSRQFDKRDSCANGDSYWYDTEDNSQPDSNHFSSERSGGVEGEGEGEGEKVSEGVEIVVNKFGYSYEKPRSPSKSSEGLNGASKRPLNPYQTEWQPNWQIVAKKNYAIARHILHEIGIDEVENVKVIHCPQAYGAVITFSICTQDLESKKISHNLSDSETDPQPQSEQNSDPRSFEIPCKSPSSNQKLKIVYSGDTRPSRLLSEVGKDCALLIHEATFEDDETGLREASAKRHCTVGEAIQVGKDMNAYRVILTHFSQRYPSVPALPPVALDYVLLAFDFMRVRFQDLLWAPSVMPALVEAFPPGTADDENDDDVVDSIAGGKVKEKEVGKENAKGQSDENSKKRKVACRCHEWVSEIEIEMEQGRTVADITGDGAVTGAVVGAVSDQNKPVAARKMCGFCSSGSGKGGVKPEAKSNNRKAPKISG